ncbi:MAG: flagellin lysine-N-methylase [Eubacterium sp.]|nr:flagellin lysine-N-methylase [Eubacterium sp.]
MQYTKPTYYDKFTCIGGACPDTCCAGWEIEIDEGTLSQYANDNGPLSSRFKNEINYNEGIFCQKPGGRCAFLNDDNLCDIYKETQDEMFWCDTCRTYPRHVEEFEGIREISIGLSCPEAARIILENTERAAFETTEDDLTEEYEDFDYMFFSILNEFRRLYFHVLKNRLYSIVDRIHQIMSYSKVIQDRVDDNEIFAIDEILMYPDCVPLIRPDAYEESKKFFEILDSLELLRPSWEALRDEYEAILFSGGKEGYYENVTLFKAYLKENDLDKRYAIVSEQIVNYFVFIYFCGSVYDYRVFAKTAFAGMSENIIRNMSMARYIKNGALSLEDIIDIAHSYAREVEHSVENLDYIDDALTEYKKDFAKFSLYP